MLPLVIACFALAMGSHEPVAPLVFALLALVRTLVATPLSVDRATQRLAMVVAIVLTVVGIRASGMSMRGPHLGAVGFGFALAPLVVVTLRVWIGQVEWSPRFDTALLLVSLLATAGARPGIVYLGFVVAFLIAHRLPLTALSARSRRIAGAIAVTAIATALSVALLAKTAYERIPQRLQNAFQGAYEPKAGLSENARLGTMAGMLMSDSVVLRVSGPPIDRVRGVVLDEYGAGRWTRVHGEPLRSVEVPRTRPIGQDIVEVRHIDPDRGHVFLPLDARDVGVAEGTLDTSSMGTAIAIGFPTVWFRKGTRDALWVAPPRPDDLTLARDIRPKLTELAADWTRDAHTPEEELAAIQSRLQHDYGYALVFDRSPSMDPILDFLTVTRKGHCEYFATALALLTRSRGIPTRMVLGYRVAERNPYWSSYVVRQKNAHAWVEAYVAEKGWVTLDPTPMTELPQDIAHDEGSASAVFEAILVAWDKISAWLAQRSVFELGGAAIVGLVVFALQRLWRSRSARGRAASGVLSFDPPPDAFVALEAAMARRGLGRERSESIERWAARLAIPELTALLQRYASARYGNASSEGLVDALKGFDAT